MVYDLTENTVDDKINLREVQGIMIKRKVKLTLMAAIALAAVMLFAVAAISETSGEAAAGRGKALFNDPSFAGGKKACNDCHLEGRNLVGVANKSRFTVMGNNLATLEDVVNFCIKNASHGKPIKKGSRDMKDMIEYLRSLSPEPIGVRG